MGQHRMFASTIIESDQFAEMPLSSQALYLHLGMKADDEGFVNSPKMIARMIGASEDDLKILIAKKFLIPFESGVVVIKHWRINNLLRKDRFKPSVYQEEKKMLYLKDNGAYTLNEADGKPLATTWQPSDNQVTTNWQPNDNQWLPQDKISKDKLSKDNISKDINDWQNVDNLDVDKFHKSIPLSFMT